MPFACSCVLPLGASKVAAATKPPSLKRWVWFTLSHIVETVLLPASPNRCAQSTTDDASAPAVAGAAHAKDSAIAAPAATGLPICFPTVSLL